MNTEMKALTDNETFELVPHPKDRQIVGAKWVYTVKTNQNGEETYKARFVAKGYSQVQDIDYKETFAPTARMSSVRTLLQRTLQNDMIINHMDVKTAYLNAPIDREIYIEQPEGFEKFGKNGEKLVCKLKRSLYGLKQIEWQKLEQFIAHIFNERKFYSITCGIRVCMFAQLTMSRMCYCDYLGRRLYHRR